MIKLPMLSAAALISALALVATPAHAAGSAAAGKNKAAACAGCHGVDGNGGADPTWPRLAGQNADYIAKQLGDFKAGRRVNAIMQGMAAPVSAQDAQDIGAYYASLKPATTSAKDANLAKQGEKLYRGGNAKSGVAACMGCHGPAGNGIPPRFPRVAGQQPAYTTAQLLAFKAGKRANDAETMTRIAFRMSEQEIKAAAEYLAALR